MLRPAIPADLARLLQIRDAAGADAMSDPALLGAAELSGLIAAGRVTAWDDGGIVGFAALDGDAIRLLVDTAARGRGVGRELLAASLARLKVAGHRAATLALAPGGTAERHYRAAGWRLAGVAEGGGRILQKPL